METVIIVIIAILLVPNQLALASHSQVIALPIAGITCEYINTHIKDIRTVLITFGIKNNVLIAPRRYSFSFKKYAIINPRILLPMIVHTPSSIFTPNDFQKAVSENILM